MKKFATFIFLILVMIALPAFAQSTAEQVTPGYVTTTGCPSGSFSCWKPYSTSAGGQLPISVTDLGNHSGYCLTSNGSGAPATFQACSGSGGSPGGSNLQIQYNNNGAFGGYTAQNTINYFGSAINFGSPTNSSPVWFNSFGGQNYLETLNTGTGYFGQGGTVQEPYPAANILYLETQGMQQDPRINGAICNTKMFTNEYGSSDNIIITGGSPNLVVTGKQFVNSVADPNNPATSGDLGKVVTISVSGVPELPTWTGTTDPNTSNQYANLYVTAIATTNSTNDTLVLNHNLPTSFNSAVTGSFYVELGGYPLSGAGNLATAVDDTHAIYAAESNSIFHGGFVPAPANCLIHKLKPVNGVHVAGNSAGSLSGTTAALTNSTTWYCSSDGYADDAGTCIDLSSLNDSLGGAEFSNISLQCGTFPYLGFSGITLAAIGGIRVGFINAETLVLDHMGYMQCPVAKGAEFGTNAQVGFTGSISGTTLTVTAITTDNFAKYVPAITSDWLAVGRIVTGAGVANNTFITAAPGAGGVGTYTVNNSQTISSEAMTAPVDSFVMGGAEIFSQGYANGIDDNGDRSDAWYWGNTRTGDYTAGVWLGPSTSASGNAANQYNDRRTEEGGAGFICDGCSETQINGEQFQFISGPAIQTIGSWSHLQVTGGMYEGNNPGATQVVLGGTGTNFSMVGAQGDKPNYSAGGYSSYMIGTASGSNVDYVSVEGGDLQTSYNVAFSNWAGNTPTHYKQVAQGIPYVDTTQTNLSVSSAGLVGIGTIAPNVSLDLGQENDAIALPVGTTGQRPTTAVAVGDIRYNSTLNTAEVYQGASPAWVSLGSGGSSVTWPTSGSIVVSNGTNSPTGLTESDGSCAVGAGGVWTTGSCAGTSSTTLGTSISATNPQRSGQATTGVYTAGTGKVDVAVITTGQIAEFSSTGLNVVPLTGYSIGGGNALSFPADNTSVSIGSGADSSATTNDANVAIGYQAMNQNANGNGNVAIGYQAGYGVSTNSKNVFIGYGSGGTGNQGNSSCIGYATCQYGGGGSTDALGEFAARYVNAQGVVAIGAGALQGNSGNASTGTGNTALGNSAGQNVQGGSAHQNLFEGYQVASSTLTTGSFNILLGTSSATDTPTSSTSYYLDIGQAIIVDMHAPTVSSGFGTSPTIPHGTSNAVFTVNVGTGGTATSGVLAFTNPAPNGWACDVVDTTSYSTITTASIPTSTSSVTLYSFSRTTGLSTAWNASDVLTVRCLGY